MISRFLRFGAYTVIGIAVVSWAALQLPAVQKWGKESLCSMLTKKSDYQITIGSVGGLPPFYLTASDISLQSNDHNRLTIDSIQLVPWWIDMVFGKISFLYASAHGIDLRQFQGSSKTGTTQLPQSSISVYTYRLSQIAIPKKYYNTILNERADNEEIDCYLTCGGSFFWNGQDETLNARLTITPYADTLSFASLDTKIHVNHSLTNVLATLDVTKTPQGSIFVSLPCDHLRLKCELEASTAYLQEALTLGSHNYAAPLIKGKWEASGLWKGHTHMALSPIVRFLAVGNLQTDSFTNLSFATDELSCQKIEPAYFSEKNQKSQSSHDLLLAVANETEDSNSLSAIHELPTPEMVQGNISVEDLTLIFKAHISQLFIGEQKISSCDLLLAATPQKEGWKGSIDASMNVAYGQKDLPVTLACDYQSQGQVSWDFPKVQLSAQDYTVAGNLKMSLFPFVLRGQLKNQTEDATSLLQHFSLKSKATKCSLSFDAQNQEDTQELTQNALFHLELQEFGNDLFFCKNAHLNMRQNGLFDSPKVDLTLTASKLETPRATIFDCVATTSVEPIIKSAPFTVTMQGSSKNGLLSLKAQGSYWSDFFHLDSLITASGGHTFQLSTPFHIQVHPESYQIAPFDFANGSGSHLFGEGTLAVKSTNFSLVSDQFPLEFFEPVLGDVTLYGPVSGHFELSGTAKAPKARCTIASSKLTLWNPHLHDAPALIASAECSYSDKRLIAFLELQGLSLKKPTLFTLEAPISLSLLPYSLKPSEKEQVKGIVEAEFDLNTLLSSYFDEEEIVEGVVSIDCKLTGTAKKPEFSGMLNWTDGKLYIPATGSTFHSIQTQGKITGSAISFDAISATDGVKGKFEGAATVSGLFRNEIAYDLKGSAVNFAAIMLDEATATATGNLHLTGNLRQAALSGAIEVNDASLGLSKELSNDLPKLDITYVSDKTDKIFKQQKPFLFHLNLDFDMPQGKIHGMGLDSDWKGKCQLSGCNANLAMNGTMAMKTGSLQFAGKQFALTQGTVEFQGDIRTKSKLQVIATNDAGAITTQIVLQGPINSPRILFQSNPAMTEKEILSWLLFNKSSTEITPLQGIQLGQTILKLNSKSDSLDILEKIKQKLHIDRLDFGVSQSVGPQKTDSAAPQEAIPNEVSVQVGKYISDGVIVTLSKDVTNEANRVGIEANIAKNVTAKATVGDDSEAELALEWKVKY